METTQDPKIRFYVQRSFGDKMNASFDFLKENWKTILKYMAYLLLPLCLIQALSLNAFMGGYIGMFMGGDFNTIDPENLGAMFWLNYSGTVLCSMIGSLLVTSLITALVKLYNEREERLNNLTFRVLRPVLFRNMGRMFAMGIILFIWMIIFTIVIALLASFALFTMLLTLPLFFAFAIAISMCLPVCLYEKISLGNAFFKGIRLGFATWGGVFAVMFIMGIIASILTGVVMLPWYLALILKALFAYSSDASVSEPSALYSFFTYILGIIFAFGIYLSAIFNVLGLSYQYAHATEKMDNITVEDDIDNFENL